MSIIIRFAKSISKVAVSSELILRYLDDLFAADLIKASKSATLKHHFSPLMNMRCVDLTPMMLSYNRARY